MKKQISVTEVKNFDEINALRAYDSIHRRKQTMNAVIIAILALLGIILFVFGFLTLSTWVIDVGAGLQLINAFLIYLLIENREEKSLVFDKILAEIVEATVIDVNHKKKVANFKTKDEKNVVIKFAKNAVISENDNVRLLRVNIPGKERYYLLNK